MKSTEQDPNVFYDEPLPEQLEKCGIVELEDGERKYISSPAWFNTAKMNGIKYKVIRPLKP